MSKFDDAKIYKIVDNTNNNIYIGSTINKLTTRLNNHKQSYKKFLNGKSRYITVFEILKNNDYKIELIEEYKCENKQELLKKEGQYILSCQCINKRVEGSTMSEIRKRHYNKYKDKIINNAKQYYNDNRDRLIEIKNVKHNCECGGRYTNTNKSQHYKTSKHIKYSN